MECSYCGINSNFKAWNNHGQITCYDCGREYIGPETEAEIKELKKELAKSHQKPKPKPKPEGLLMEAHQIINGERVDQYGKPEMSLEIIAAFWEDYLNHRKPGPLTAIDAVNMEMLKKIARAMGQEVKRDNYVDIAGYAGIAGDRLIKTVL